MFQNKKTKKRPIFITGLCLIAVIAVTVGVYAYTHRNSSETTSPNVATSTIDMSPATPADQEYSNTFKPSEDQKESTSTTDPPPTDAKKTLKPVIVDASQYESSIEARGYVPGTIEDGGTCTFTFKSGNASVTKRAAGHADATTTRCDNINFSVNDLSTGTWSTTLSYESSVYTGTSDAISLEVK